MQINLETLIRAIRTLETHNDDGILTACLCTECDSANVLLRAATADQVNQARQTIKLCR